MSRSLLVGMTVGGKSSFYLSGYVFVINRENLQYRITVDLILMSLFMNTNGERKYSQAP